MTGPWRVLRTVTGTSAPPRRPRTARRRGRLRSGIAPASCSVIAGRATHAEEAGHCTIEFFKRVRTVMLTAFSTSSSNATLPTALRVSEANLGVPREIGAFVLTIGATANQNGTALFEGVTVIFLAQFFGVELTLVQQVMVMLVCILGGIGTALRRSDGPCTARY